MRLATGLSALCLSLAMVGCGGGGGGGGDDDVDPTPDAADLPPPTEGFQIRTPDLRIEPGEERTDCYYTTIDIDQAVGVKRWASSMTPGSHHLILYFTESRQQPDGTVVRDCGLFGGGFNNVPVWTYSAGTPEAEMTMPAGVGMRVNAQQHVLVQMHYFNTSPTTAIDAHVTINGETYAAADTYTPASAFITFNTQIDIDPYTGPGTGYGEASGSCRVPAGRNFFALSTHAHRRATLTQVRDGTTLVFESDDWEHPGAATWITTPHYQFLGNLNYHCEYQNDINQRVRTGDSAETDEMCMAVGYMFPAEQPTWCFDSITL
jgi:hypothetical protein